MFKSEYNPLLARSRRKRTVILSAVAALGLLTTGALAFTASGSSAPGGETAKSETAFSQPIAAKVETAKAETVAIETAQQSAPRRQVRVIPLFNTPNNQTGHSAK